MGREDPQHTRHLGYLGQAAERGCHRAVRCEVRSARTTGLRQNSYVKDKDGTVKAAQYTTSCSILSLRVSHCLLLSILQSALSFLSCRVPIRHGHPFAQGSPR